MQEDGSVSLFLHESTDTNPSTLHTNFIVFKFVNSHFHNEHLIRCAHQKRTQSRIDDMLQSKENDRNLIEKIYSIADMPMFSKETEDYLRSFCSDRETIPCDMTVLPSGSSSSKIKRSDGIKILEDENKNERNEDGHSRINSSLSL